MKFNLNLKWTAVGRKAAAVLCTLLFLMLALTLSGCTGKAEKPAMVVNDVAVPQGVLNYYINYGKDYLASYGIDINDPETGAQYMSLIEEQGVDIVTEIAVVRALAKEAGLSVAPEQIAENLQTEKSYFTDDAAWQEWLTTYQLTEDDVEWILEYQLLADALFEHVNQDLTMTDEEVAAIYNANPSDYDTYRFGHILITPDGDDNAAWATALQTANEALSKINAGEATFEELAGQYNPDSTKATGGDLGQYCTQNASPYVDEFSQAAFALTEVGQVSAVPVRTSFGYHLIKLLDKTSGVESARDAIITAQLGEARTAKYNEYLNEAVANAVVSQEYQRQYVVENNSTDNGENDTNTTDTETDNAGNN